MLAVSVIIPTFNGAQFIGRTLDSILQQDYPPAEIIVVNDGSTDDTASVVRTYAPGVRLIDIENGGPTGARLTAVRAAKSEWVAFCDSDDLWHPDHLSGLVGLADTHSVPFAFSNFRHVKNGTVAGSIAILDYARINHDLNQEYLAAVSREIVSRSIYGIDCCFNQRRFEDVAIFERNLSRTDTPLKTAIKIAVSKQPRFSACLLSTALTAAGNGARLSRLLRHTRAPA